MLAVADRANTLACNSLCPPYINLVHPCEVWLDKHLDKGRVQYNFNKNGWDVSYRKEDGCRRTVKEFMPLGLYAADGTPIVSPSGYEAKCKSLLGLARKRWNESDKSTGTRYEEHMFGDSDDA